MGKGNEDEHRFTQNLVPFMLRHVFNCPAIVQAVSKFDQHNPYIIVESKKDTLEILRLYALLLCLVFIVKDRFDLGKSIHEGSDLVSEKIPDIIDRVVGIFNHIMQQGGYNGFITKADIADHNLCNCNRMQDIRLSRTPSDTFMGLIGKIKCLLHNFKLIHVRTPLACSFPEICEVTGYDLIILLGEF